jgi:RNA polymerase sigma-70 factor (ECF subfamily)
LEEPEFIRLIQKHTGIIQKIIYLYVDDPENKRDLKQEIHLQAWKSIRSFKGNSQFSTWLYRVSLNTILTFKRKKRVDTSTINDFDSPQESNDKGEKSEMLLTAIKMLNDVDKTIITLHLEDYNNEEIAEILGLKKNHIAVKLHRIKELLTKKLRAHING